MRRLCLLVFVLPVLAAPGCGDDDRPNRGADADSGPVHVHGLGINPNDGALFIATHTGLFRAAEGEPKATRVGDSTQDTMGFTVVGPDRFLGSGHPAEGEDRPPLLGLIRSDDGGRGWESVSLSGEADFHVLRAAHGRVYGFDASGGRFMVSSDGGRGWSERTPPGPVLDLAVDPDDPERFIVSTDRALLSSRDGGSGWRPIRGSQPGFLAWAAARVLYHIDVTGRVRSSADAGRSWRSLGAIGGQPAAFIAAGNELYAALADGTVMRSTDGGKAWRVRSTP